MRPRVYALGIWLVFSAVGALGSTGSTARQDLLAAAARGDGNALRLLTAGGDGTSSSTDGDDGGNPATLCRALLVASRLGHPGVVSTLLELGATSNCGDVLPSKQFWRVLAASRDVDLIDVLQTFYKHVNTRKSRPEIKGILSKYQGSERALLRKLRKKYKPQLGGADPVEAHNSKMAGKKGHTPLALYNPLELALDGLQFQRTGTITIIDTSMIPGAKVLRPRDGARGTVQAFDPADKRYTVAFEGQPAGSPSPSYVKVSEIVPAFGGPEQDHLEVVRLLLTAGADALANAKKGRSPLDIALNRAMEDALELLLASLPCDDLGPFIAGPKAAAVQHIINPQLVQFSPVTQDRARGFTEYCKLYNKHIGEHRDWADFCRSMWFEVGARSERCADDECTNLCAPPSVPQSLINNYRKGRVGGNCLQSDFGGAIYDPATERLLNVVAKHADRCAVDLAGAVNGKAEHWDDISEPLLHIASRTIGGRTASLLVRLGANVQAIEDEVGRTALHHAVLDMDLEVVVALVQVAGDARVGLLDVRDEMGHQASDYADIATSMGDASFACVLDAARQGRALESCQTRAESRATGPTLVPLSTASPIPSPSVVGEEGWRTYPAGVVPPLLADIGESRCDILELQHPVNETEYALASKGYELPVIIRGGAKIFPARTAWTAERLGTDTCPASKRYSPYAYIDQTEGASLHHSESTTIGAFVRELVENEDVVDLEHPPPYIFEDIVEAASSELLGEGFGPFFGLVPLRGVKIRKGELMVGGMGTGAPGHEHVTAANALFFGRKRWAIMPPPKKMWSQQTALQWFSDSAVMNQAFHCVQNAGDVIILPAAWMHAVLNVEDAVATALEFDTPTKKRRTELKARLAAQKAKEAEQNPKNEKKKKKKKKKKNVNKQKTKNPKKDKADL